MEYPGKMPITTSDWHQRFVQQKRWTRELRRHLLARLDLGQDSRILEVGSGTGAVLQEFEQEANQGGKLYGLDLNQEFLSFAAQELAQTRLVSGDGFSLPFPGSTFDLVFCHFLLLWVPGPLEIVLEMKRVARRGGWVAALAEPDYDGRLDYPPEMAQLGRLQESALADQGAWTRIGRQLRAIFAAAGLAEVECGVFGGQWKTAPGPGDIDLEWKVLREDLQQFDPHELKKLERIDRAAWQAGTRLLFVPTFFAFGRNL